MTAPNVSNFLNNLHHKCVKKVKHTHATQCHIYWKNRFMKNVILCTIPGAILESNKPGILHSEYLLFLFLFRDFWIIMFYTFTFLICNYYKIKHINIEETFSHCSGFQTLFHISFNWGAFKNPCPCWTAN